MSNTLVQLMEWSHVEHMMGRLTEKKHQSIHVSWEKITKTFYAAMKTFEVQVSRSELVVSTLTIEVDAIDQAQAEEFALNLAPKKYDNWDECGAAEEYNFQVEDVDEIPKEYPYYCDCHKEGFDSMEECAAHEKEIGAIGDDL